MTPLEDTSVIVLGEHTPTFDEIAFAERNLAPLPTLVSFSPMHKVRHFERNGKWFRKAGQILASPGSSNRFRIWLYEGAGPTDLNRFEGLIADAKRGNLGGNGWETFGFDEESPATYLFNLALEIPPQHADKLVGLEEFRPCDVSSCIDDYHTWEGDHLVDYHAGEPLVGDGYQIQLLMEKGEWAVEFGDRGSETLLSPDAIASFISDLRWQAAEARKLNEALNA